MSDYRSSFEREMARWAKKRGWVVLGRNGVNHLVVMWPGNGHKHVIPGTGGGRLKLNIERQIIRAEDAAV